MQIRLASHYGFCFGVKRAINIAQKHKSSNTMGPLIHNQNEIDRLKNSFDIGLYHTLDEVKKNDTIIIRTHGITKENMLKLKSKDTNIINATCPYVTTLQNIVKNIDDTSYSIVIFGDAKHPEVMGVKSWAKNQKDIYVVLTVEELDDISFKHDKVAIVAQTTRNKEKFLEVANKLILNFKEVKVFNTICDATLQNQEATKDLSKESDIMIVIGGKNSSNTRQLFNISKEFCKDSYLIENSSELDTSWAKDKQKCGITAGASTPDWIIEEVIEKLKETNE